MASEILRDLFAKRDAAFTDYDYVASVYRSAASEGSVPEEYTNEYQARKAAIEAIDERILEVEAEEARAREINEARKRAGIDIEIPNVSVNEPRTYGPGSPNSYFADFVRSSDRNFKGHREACLRLDQWSAEVAGEMRDPNSAEGKRAIEVVKNTNREADPRVAAEAIDRARSFTASEVRNGMDTTSGSGGSFVTPQYFVSEYAPFRNFGRVFADQANKQDLPDYGMTIYLPHVTGAAAVSAQGTQNSGVAETDPTAGYLSTSLTTNAGQVTVSQQLLDRAGPNFAFDKMVFDQLQRAYNATLDIYVLTQALANAGTLSLSSFTPQTFRSKVAGAKAAIKDTNGTVLPATHIFAPTANWEWITAQTDSTSGRPAFPESVNGPFNAFGSGDPAPVAEGYSGYKVAGLPVFEDANIPTASSNNQVLVTNMDEVWFWEGDLVTRTVPQTYANNLSVLLQVYAYVGCIVPYSAAVQAIQGAAFPTSPSF